MKRLRTAMTLAALALSAPVLTAQNVLIINGAAGTSEPGTTASITTQLRNLHTAVGNVVTVVDGVPVSLSGFQQVWDIRFFNNAALTSGVQAQYLAYLQAGGRMFVMGENSSFMTRNNSIFSLINAAGGGNVGFEGNCESRQTVQAPFTGPNAVTTIDYLAPGCFNGRGTGQWISNAGASGAGVAWTIGTLANASAGALTSILDVNFMQTDANAGSQALTRNLIGFVTAPPPPVGVVPEPSTYALMVTGLAGVAALRRRRTRA
jgi:hypothetical protein